MSVNLRVGFIGLGAMGSGMARNLHKHGLLSAVWNRTSAKAQALSQETGGRLFHVLDVVQLPAIYQQVADELASQYFLGYVSKNAKRDGSWRRVMVRVVRPNVVTRTKSGYFGPKSRQ